MRPAAVAVVSAVSAALGAALALAVAVALGWGDDDAQETTAAPRGTVTFVAETDGEPAARPAQPLAGNEFEPAEIYAARADGVVTVYALSGDHPQEGTAGQGSGFVVSREGYILTNSHVITNVAENVPADEVEAADDVFVQFRDGERIPAQVVGFDLFDDVGVLKVDPKAHPLTVLPLGDSSKVVVGEPVAAIGSPFGAESSLAVGVVSATRSVDALTSLYRLVDAIQTDAPINRGNSGGPLFDARGRVIGINAQIRSNSGLSEGVGFAVPINAAKRSMKELIETGRVRYAYVGIGTEDLTPQLARHLKLRARRGALVAEVRDDGPAQEAGLRGGNRAIFFQGAEVTVGGDVILAVDDEPVESGDELVRIVTNDLRPGQRVVLTVLRDGKRVRVPVELDERPLTPEG
jgi:2-alkenal reductase